MEKYFPPFELKGKRALITEATQGIGAAIAGASIIINATNEKKLNNCLGEMREMGIAVDGCLFDIRITRSVREAVNKIERDIGSIDILVINAGIIRGAPAEHLQEEDWDAVIQTYLTAPFLLSKYVEEI